MKRLALVSVILASLVSLQGCAWIKTNPDSPMGQASVQVDDRSPVLREGWFEQTWGGYRQTSLLARDLSPGKHKVRIELLPKKNPQSTGHEFRVLGLGAAGVRLRPPDPVEKR